jgi:hypothetical protein
MLFCWVVENPKKFGYKAKGKEVDVAASTEMLPPLLHAQTRLSKVEQVEMGVANYGCNIGTVDHISEKREHLQ